MHISCDRVLECCRSGSAQQLVPCLLPRAQLGDTSLSFSCHCHSSAHRRPSANHGHSCRSSVTRLQIIASSHGTFTSKHKSSPLQIRSLSLKAAATSDSPPQDFPVASTDGGHALEAPDKLSEEERQQLREQFDRFDKDGNGVIDKNELRDLLEGISGDDNTSTAQHWVVDAIVDSVMASFDSEGNNDLTFSDFARLMDDSVLLDGKLREYQDAFQAIDTSGNGLLTASEVKALFEDLGHSLTDQKLFDIMEKCDAGGQGQLAFNDFLGLFREELLEAQEVVAYISMRASASEPLPRKASLIEWSPGEPILIFSSQEMDALMEAHPQRVIVLEASFTWCRPCKAFQRPYERFAEAYPETIFLKFFGNSNENTKALFQDRLHTPTTPHFTLWRNGEKLAEHSGANKGKMLASLDSHLSDWDNPIAGASKFKKQVWSARLLGTGSAPLTH